MLNTRELGLTNLNPLGGTAIRAEPTAAVQVTTERENVRFFGVGQYLQLTPVMMRT